MGKLPAWQSSEPSECFFFVVEPKGECIARPERMRDRKELMRLVETRRQEEGYPGIN